MNQIMAASMVGQQRKFCVLKPTQLPQKHFQIELLTKIIETKIYFKSTEIVSSYFFMC